MSWSPSAPYLIGLAVSAVISAALALYVWRYRPAPGVVPFAVLMLAVAVWSLVSALRMASPDLPTKVFWAQVRYLGIVVVPAAWLAFALEYTGRGRWLTRRNLILLTIEPVVFLLLVWTNDIHHLVWTHVGLDTSGGFPGWHADHGPAHWLHAAYSYLLLLPGALLLIQAAIRTPRPLLYRRQAVALLIGALAPVVANAISTSGWSPFPYVDLTPFGFTIAGLVAAWGLYQLRLFDVTPVARDAVVESMSDGVLVLDAQGRVVDLNPAAQRVLGCTAAETIGQPVSALGMDDLTIAVGAVRRHAAQRPGRVDASAATSQTPVGKEITSPGGRTLYANISPVRDAGWVVLLQDVTPLKELDQLRTEWVAAVSHDMKNPLTAIQLSTGLLEEIGPLNPEQRKLLEMTRINAMRLWSLVTDVLDLARLEAGPVVQAGPVSIPMILAEVLGEVRSIAENKKQVLITDLPPSLPLVWGNAVLLTRALSNLLNNAVKYTPVDGRITVRARPRDDVIQVEVIDTGLGISVEALPHLFDRFYRVPGDVQKVEGSGLGLSIVRAIVEKHNGRVWVESERGRGSTFGFTVPTIQSADG